MKQNQDQERAKAAWAATIEHVGKDYFSDYCSLCAGAPVMILTNGLGPTLAFFMAKGQEGSGDKEKKQFIKLGNAIAKWVLKSNSATTSNLMLKITESDVDTYRHYTQETLAYLQWLKRFAEANKPS